MENLEMESSSGNSSGIIKPVDDEAAEEVFNVELPPHEIVFSFNHIMEQIFRYLDTPDHFSCRLVSHRFLKIANTPLKKLEMLFHSQDQDYLQFFDSVPLTGRTLTQFTEFLQSSSSSTTESKAKLNSFPLIRFHFYGCRLGDDVFQKFLNIYGENVRDLVISSYTDRQPHESVLMDQLSQLLTRQAPHLEDLSLCNIEPKVEWQQENGSRSRIHSPGSNDQYQRSPLLKTDPEVEQISSRVKSLSRKSNLKLLQIEYTFGFAKVLELIFQISPQLQQVMLPAQDCVYLVHPVSRVHLLKTLQFGSYSASYAARDDDGRSFNVMEKISLGDGLRLRTLTVRSSANRTPYEANSEFEERVVSALNRILEQSRDTLEYLQLSYSMTFLRGIKVPWPMAQVRKIKMNTCGINCNRNWTVFPKGFPFSKTFPNLAYVELEHYTDGDNFYNSLNCLDFQKDGDSALSTSVGKVKLSSGCLYNCVTIPTFISERVQKLFPNARIVLRNHRKD